MTANGLNTLEYAKKLQEAGVPEEQAAAQALCLYEIISSGLATKRDIEELRVELKRDIKELESKMVIKLGGLLIVALGAMVALTRLGIL